MDKQNFGDFNKVIKSSIQAEMLRRNYRVDNTNPDLLVRYELIASTTVESRNTMISPYDTQNFSVPRSYTEAILLIELINSKTKKLVWQASADLKDHQKKSRKNPMESTVSSIFNTYLYKAGESSPDESLKTK